MDSMFRQDAVEHNLQGQEWGEATFLRAPPASLLFWTAMVATLAIIGFLSAAQYSRKETVSGFLSPKSGIVRVFVPRSGIAAKVHVEEGEFVRSGDPLVTVISNQTTAAGESVNALVVAALRQQQEVISEQIAAQSKRQRDESANLDARIAGVRQEIVHLKAQIASQQQRVDLLEALNAAESGLVENGYVAANQRARSLEAVLEQKLTLGALREQLAAKGAAIARNRLALQQLPDAMADETRRLRAQQLEVEQRLAEADAQRAYVLRAPVAGIVSTLQAFVGRSVEPQQLQLSLLPEHGELQAQIFVPTRAAGFVRPGQAVRLRYDAFPYQRFGAQSGRILTVSRTILNDADRAAPFPLAEPSYEITVALDVQSIDANGEPVPLQADMLLRADIILDRASLMTWLLDPLLSAGRRL